MYTSTQSLIMTAALAAATPGLASAEPVVARATVDEIARFLTDDALQGRDNLTPGNLAAQEYLEGWLVDLGLSPAGTDGFGQAFPEGRNLLGIYHPPGTAGSAPVVLIGAHFDHVGTRCRARPEAASSWCNGAADNASSVAAALGAVEALAGQIGQPVAVALWDAEEDGKVGSEYFAAQPSFDVSELVLYINLDIVGLHLFEGMETLTFAIGAESGGKALGADVAASLEGLNLQTERISYVFGLGRSDMDSFVSADYDLPFVFFSDGDGAVYHTTADEYQVLDIDKTWAVSQCIARLAVRASRTTYTWQEPLYGSFKPTFSDAQVITRALHDVADLASLNQLTPTQVADLNAWVATLDKILAQGPARYRTGEAGQVLLAAQFALNLSSNLTFIP